MKALKKAVSVLLSAALVLSLSVVAFASEGEEPSEGLDPELDAAIEEQFYDMLNGEDEEDITEFFPVEPVESAGTFAEDAPVTLVDNDDIAVVVSGYDAEDEYGPTFNLTITNKTEATLMFSLDDVSVNGFMVDPFWATRVGAGEKVESDFGWEAEDLAASGIQYIENIEALLWVYDSEDFDAEDIYNGRIAWDMDTADMEGEPAVVAPEFSIDAISLLDSEDVSVSAVEFDATAEDGPELTVLVENRSDTIIMVRAEDVAVNGASINPFWFEILYPGKSVYSTLTIDSDDLIDQKIAAIETIEMNVTVTDYSIGSAYELMDSNQVVIDMNTL